MGEDTWSVERFQLELLKAEKTEKFGYNDLLPLWEKAKLAISNEEEACSLYTTFIYMTLRFIKKQGSTDYTKVEELFEEVSCFIDECFEQYSESSIQLEKNYANFLYTKMKKVEKAREIWANLLEGETGPFAWLEAINLEKCYGNIENARRLFYKALDSVNFRPHIIYSAFIQFEREEGNRLELDTALDKVNLLASTLNLEEEKQQKQQFKHQDRKRKSNNFDRNKQQGGKQKSFDKKAKHQKIEKNDNNNDDLKDKSLPQQKTNKRKQQQPKSKNNEAELKMDIDNKNEEKEEKIEQVTFQTSNIPIGPIIPGFNDQKNILEKTEKNDVEMVQVDEHDKNNKNEENKKEEDKKEKKHQKQQQEHLNDPSFPYSTGLEKNKLFVKNLHFGVKGPELLKFFSKFGKVLDIRLITKWNGRSKGCAYIDFEKDSEASAAVLGANGEKIRGKEISVYLSNPSIAKRSTDINKPSTSFNENKNKEEKKEGKEDEKKEEKNKNFLNFIPRNQRIGKSSRLMIPTSISKINNKNEEMKEITKSTEDISMKQK